MLHDLSLMKRVTEDVVRKEPRPAFTDSWHPFSHGEIIDCMTNACDKLKLDVTKKEYSIREGSKMFAAWEMKNGHEEFNFGIGFRNAIDKTHSIAVCLFMKVFICSNFVFQSFRDWVLFRKHTGLLTLNEVTFYAEEALGLILEKRNVFCKWHDDMKSMKLSAERSSLLTVGAVNRGLIPPTHLKQFITLYQGSDSKYKDYAGTLYAWHGAGTELMRDDKIQNIMNWSDKFNYYVDYEAPILMKQASRPSVNFLDVRNSAFKIYQEDMKNHKEAVRKLGAEVREKFQEVRKQEVQEQKKSHEVDAPAKKQRKSDESVALKAKKQRAKSLSGRKLSKRAEKELVKKTKQERKALINAVDFKKQKRLEKKLRKENLKKSPGLKKTNPELKIKGTIFDDDFMLKD